MPGLADGVGRSPRLRRFAALRARSAEWGWEVMGTTADFSLHYPVPDMLGALSARAELAVGGEWSGWPAQVALIAARPPSPRVRLGLPAPRATFLLAVIDGGPMSCQFAAEAVRGGIDVVMLSRGSLPEAARRRLHAAVGSGALRPGDHVAVGEVQMLTARRLRHAGGSLDPARQLDLLVDLIEDLADLG
ncbi:MAG: hypothetical protein H0U48_01275 [Euzebyaceae bacterium]|nr:hypothetical protein [Euzebyaceae bacterium]